MLEARRRRRVLVCFDKHADQRTRYTWSEDLEARGGRVIQITGGPEQPPIEAAAKVLIHYAAWQAFFGEQDTAVATLGKTGNPRLLGRRDLQALSCHLAADRHSGRTATFARAGRRARQAPQDQRGRRLARRRAEPAGRRGRNGFSRPTDADEADLFKSHMVHLVLPVVLG